MILLLASALTIMSGATIAPSLPAIREHFRDVSQVDVLVRLILTTPALVVILFAPVAGSLADRFSRKRLLVGAIILFGISGSAGLILNSLNAILASRAMVGLAVAIIMTSTTALVADYFPSGKDRESFMGKQAAFFGFGGLLFLTIGGILADISWRLPFLVYSTALLIPYFALRFLDEPGHSKITTPKTQISAGHWQGKVALLFLFSILNSLTFYLLPTQVPFYVKEFAIGNSTFTGIAIGTATLVSSIASLAYVRLKAKMTFKTIFFSGFLLMAGAYQILANSHSKFETIFAMVVAGLGMGVLMPNIMVTSMSFAPEHLRGRVAGAITTSIFLGQFVSPLVSQPWAERFTLPIMFRDASILLVAISIASLGWGKLGGHDQVKKTARKN